MPGVSSANGLTTTCGLAIVPLIANVMPNTPSPRGPVRIGPSSGIEAITCMMPVPPT